MMLLTWQGELSAQKRWVVPSYYCVLELSEEYILKDINLKETTGNNDGEHIKLYMQAVGLDYNKHYPYCMAGQYYYLLKAAKECDKTAPVLRTASTIKIYEWATKKGTVSVYEANRHDLVVWKTLNKSSGHVGRIYMVHDRGNITTLEMNTSNGITGSQRNGNTNAIRKRNLYTPIGRMTIRGLIGFKYEPPQCTYRCTITE